jgi:hypothetical protein
MKILKDDLASLREDQREFQFEEVDHNFDGIWNKFPIPFFIF